MVSVADFKTQLRPILGSAPGLEKVLEHGEYTRGPMLDDASSATQFSPIATSLLHAARTSRNSKATEVVILPWLSFGCGGWI
jgi:hypothetical protein